ncbi:MAG TPA: hypothetical protein VGF55_28415, partial [Gemmataceae bacterium]
MTERPLIPSRRPPMRSRRGGHRFRPALLELECRCQPAAHGLPSGLIHHPSEAAPQALAAVSSRLELTADTAAIAVNIVEDVQLQSFSAAPHGRALGHISHAETSQSDDQTDSESAGPRGVAVGLRGREDILVISEAVFAVVVRVQPRPVADEA